MMTPARKPIVGLITPDLLWALATLVAEANQGASGAPDDDQISEAEDEIMESLESWYHVEDVNSTLVITDKSDGDEAQDEHEIVTSAGTGVMRRL
jgi:hypothetical protein